jgi:2-polyprenyl-6-methoxyphenol hydroxylase-like FAD-dependent oxidoreductase
MSDEINTQVLVVGAGPAGLATAITLGAYGIETLVVERRRSGSTLPRANTLSTGTMELLRRWGLEREVRERAPELEVRPLSVATLAGAGAGQPVDAGFPTRQQARLVSPTSPASLGQDELEPILEARARSLPSVRIARGVELLGLDQRDGLVATLGGHRRARARYVVGADGMHSRVREALGIDAEGPGQLEERLVIHFRAPLWELVGEHRYAIYFLTSEPEGRSVLPAGSPDRWVYAQTWDSAVADPVTEAQARALVRAAAGAPGLPVRDVTVGVTSYGVGLADRFREGDAFLIGDAAHRVTPRGATGLNTAIRDGFDLGWKLAWVLRGWSGAALLDSYERERRPIAEFNTGRSMRPDGSLLGTSTGLHADIGGRIPHVWVSGRTSTLDLLGPGLTLFAGPDWDGDAHHRESGPPIRVERLDELSARGLGLGPSGWLLARPDGHPVTLRNAAV